MNQQTRCRLCHGWMPSSANFCGLCGEAMQKPLPSPPLPPGGLRGPVMVLTTIAAIALLVGFGGGRYLRAQALPGEPAQHSTLAWDPTPYTHPAPSNVAPVVAPMEPEWHTCRRCGGTGTEIRMWGPGYGPHEVEAVCAACGGTGRIWRGGY